MVWRGPFFIYIFVYFNDFCTIFMGFVAHETHEKSKEIHDFFKEIIENQ